MALTQGQQGLALLQQQMRQAGMPVPLAQQQAQVRNAMVPTQPGAGQTTLPVQSGVAAASQPRPNTAPAAGGGRKPNQPPAGVQQGLQQAAQPNTAPPGGGGQKPNQAPAGVQQGVRQAAAPAIPGQAGYRATAQAQNNPMGSAQLGYALNSGDPQMRAAAEAQFRQSLQNDPAAMQRFRNEVAGGRNTAPAGGGGQKPQASPSTQATPNAGSGYASPEQTVKMFQALMEQDPSKGYAFARGEGEFARPGSGQKTPQGSSSAAQPLPTGPKPATPAPTPAGPTFADALGAQFGADNPFGVRELGGENPLETAKAAAQRMLESNIANTRARFGGMGTANSDRAALAEGQAIGDMSTFLGDRLANIGEQAFQNDANRALSAILGAGQNDLARSQLALGLNQQLGGFGTGLTGVGAQETQIPNLGEIIGYLAAFSGAGGGGTSKGSGAQGFGWKR